MASADGEVRVLMRIGPIRQQPAAIVARGQQGSRLPEGAVAHVHGDAEAHLLEGDELARGEAGEDDDDDRRGAGDQPGGGRDAVDDRRQGAAGLEQGFGSIPHKATLTTRYKFSQGGP